MLAARVIVLSFLVITALCASVKVQPNEDTITLFHGEDFHILLPSLDVEITFKNKSSPRSPEVVLLRGTKEVSTRVKLNQYHKHLVIEAVEEGDEGIYTVKNPDSPDEAKRIVLYVRDCSNEEIIKYGGNLKMSLSGVDLPITLEYRPSAVEANQTSSPALVIRTNTGTTTKPYRGRISVDDRYVTISDVTGADEGSYAVSDAKGDIKKKVCLNVKEHQNFVTLPHGKKLKINLILNSSLVHLYYIPDNDPTPRLLLDKGEFTSARTELGLEDRLTMEGSLVYLDQVKSADVGVFKITDLQGFTVSTIHLGLLPYRLESLYVAIIALLGLLVFLLLVCLLSCLIKVKKRAKRAAALEKIAQNAGKEDEGEAFRQVVKNITKLSEESKHSQADTTEKSQSTEVDIKGLEVSSKEVGVGNLETSDSGVGFNTALPLDTDTDAPDQIPDSEAVSISESKPSPPAAAECKPSAPPAMEMQSSPIPETEVSPAPETKKTPDHPVEAKLDQPKPPDVKIFPTPSPEPTAAPADSKPPPSPSPEPKPAVPKATAPAPESKSALTPTPESPKPTTPEPITNGTPEPGPESKPSPDHTDIIGSSAPKAVPPKTPEVELKSSSAALESSKDGNLADDSTTTT